MEAGCPGERLNIERVFNGALPSGIPRQSDLTYRQSRTSQVYHRPEAQKAGLLRLFVQRVFAVYSTATLSTSASVAGLGATAGRAAGALGVMSGTLPPPAT